MNTPSLEARITLLEQQIAKLLAKDANDVILNEPAKAIQARLDRFVSSYDPRGEL